MLSFVGFCSLTVQAGIPPGASRVMTGIVWALPAKVILVSSILSGAQSCDGFLAVTLSSVRLMPMVAHSFPNPYAEDADMAVLFAFAFHRHTAWVFAMERVHAVPRRHRATFFAASASRWSRRNMALVGIVYRLVADFPPIVARMSLLSDAGLFPRSI
ncbi:hypothetical protein F2981_13525 [Sinorhizobium meliloti]|nr:hypothetical protein [Sinorhizobium meliloti]